MNVGYQDTKNKQGGHSPLMSKKKKGGFLKKVAGKVGKVAGKVQGAVKGATDAYKAGKASVQQ